MQNGVHYSRSCLSNKDLNTHCNREQKENDSTYVCTYNKGIENELIISIYHSNNTITSTNKGVKDHATRNNA